MVIGLSLDTLKEARWQKDRDLFVDRAKALGAEVKVQSANSDDTRQIQDVQSLISAGINVLVIVPHNGEAMAKAVELAHDVGIPVIAYDRLITSSDLDLYITFDNEKVGEIQGNYIVENLDDYELALNPSDLVGGLGVGQKQLVEILKALAKDAKIFLLDEPTSALPEKEVKTLLSIVKKLKAKGISCIYISHKLEEVLEIADSITVIRDGESIDSKPRNDWTYESIVAAMVGRKIEDLFPRRKSNIGEVLMDVENVSAGMLHGISFQLNAGEVLGIGGLMGAGRSELLMHLFCGEHERLNGNVR